MDDYNPLAGKSRKRTAQRQALAVGDKDAIRRVNRWSPGGRMPHHKHFERAKRVARKFGHLLGRFFCGKDAEGKPDHDSYGAECRFCSALVTVWRDYDGSDPPAWRMAGPAIQNRCRETK
jgi:hypothetical protein